MGTWRERRAGPEWAVSPRQDNRWAPGNLMPRYHCEGCFTRYGASRRDDDWLDGAQHPLPLRVKPGKLALGGSSDLLGGDQPGPPERGAGVGY